MKKTITWTTPEGNKCHEVSEDATIKFELENGNILEIGFQEDESIRVHVTGNAEFVHSYFVPAPELPKWEEIPEKTKGCGLYKHTIFSGQFPQDPFFDLRPHTKGSDDMVATVVSLFPKEWVPEDMQGVYAPIFPVEEETGKVFMPSDLRANQADEPEIMVLKSKSELLSKVECRDLAVPGTEAYEQLISSAMDSMKILGWKYFYQLEERGDKKNTYIYARGC